MTPTEEAVSARVDALVNGSFYIMIVVLLLVALVPVFLKVENTVLSVGARLLLLFVLALTYFLSMSKLNDRLTERALERERKRLRASFIASPPSGR